MTLDESPIKWTVKRKKKSNWKLWLRKGHWSYVGVERKHSYRMQTTLHTHLSFHLCRLKKNLRPKNLISTSHPFKNIASIKYVSRNFSKRNLYLYSSTDKHMCTLNLNFVKWLKIIFSPWYHYINPSFINMEIFIFFFFLGWKCRTTPSGGMQNLTSFVKWVPMHLLEF